MEKWHALWRDFLPSKPRGFLWTTNVVIQPLTSISRATVSSCKALLWPLSATPAWPLMIQARKMDSYGTNWCWRFSQLEGAMVSGSFSPPQNSSSDSSTEHMSTSKFIYPQSYSALVFFDTVFWFFFYLWVCLLCLLWRLPNSVRTLSILNWQSRILSKFC